MLALAKIKHDALAYFGNFFQRPPELIAGIVDCRTEHVAGDILSMHAHEDRIVRADLAHYHRQMHVAIDRVLKSDGTKSSINSRQISFDRATYENFLADAIVNQIGDGDDLQAMHDREVAQLRQPRHRAVFVHDFADDAGGIKPGNARNVHRRFRLTGTNQHPALPGA